MSDDMPPVLDVPAAEPIADGAEPAAPQEQAPKPANEQKLSRAFAEIARREKMIRQKEQEFQSRSGDLELVELLKTNPLAALEKSGKSYDEITKEKLKQLYPDSPDTQFMMLKDELSSLKKLIADKEEQEKQYSTQAMERARQQAVNHFKSEITKELQASADEFSLLASWPNPEEEVFEYIEAVLKETGKVIPIKQACQEIEEGFDSNIVQKMLQTNKIKSRFTNAGGNVSYKSQVVPAKVTSAEMKTINNNLQSGAVAPKPRKFTREEAIAMAVEQSRRR